ncbi:MAG: hypothetical protein IJD55_04630 [Clostridia bacterium]|nr:hypothetical protein [Clostridia bacterium]
MFGYVRAAKPELKVKEYEMYKAVYCTLCKTLGKSYGFLARLTLSYDFTFLALLNMSLKDTCVCIEKKRCPFNPFKKCNYCKNKEDLEMPAAAAMIMLYYKLNDNIADEKGFKKIGYKLIKPFFSSARKKASKKYPKIEGIVSAYIENQTRLESKNCSNLDEISDPTAKALSQILMLCSDDNTQKRILDRIGYCIGRYIYILDAACDLEKDIKNNSYNVLKEGYTGKFKDYIEEKVLPQLYFCINEAASAFELLEIKKYKTILGNIIYLGLEETFKKELNL